MNPDIAGNVISNSTTLNQLRSEILESHQEMAEIRTSIASLRTRQNEGHTHTEEGHDIVTELLAHNNSLIDLKMETMDRHNEYIQEKARLSVLSHAFHEASRQNLNQSHFP